MSKKYKIIIAVLSLLLVGGGAFWILKPKVNPGYEAKEIRIEQAEVPKISNLIYRDSSGFSFNYPSLITVNEVELDDSSVFSSLELTGTNNSKIKLRIADSKFNDIEEWQKNFELDQSITQSSHLLWVDIPAIQVVYGAPKMLLTVAVENGVIYSLESELDNGGFFDQAHETILSSFEFDPSVMKETKVDAEVSQESSESADVVLIEETLE